MRSGFFVWACLLGAFLQASVVAIPSHISLDPRLPGGMCGWMMSAVDWALRRPPQIPRVQIQHPALGQGGMGRVWQGVEKNPKGDLHYIIKEALPGFEAALRREARVLRRIYGDDVKIVEEGGETYVIMPLFPKSPEKSDIPAPTLHRLLYEGGANRFHSLDLAQRDPAYIAKVEESFLKELASLHAHPDKIVHGDLKPLNILVGHDASGNPIVRIIDFGLAAVNDRQPASGAYGTPEYMSREAWQGKQSTPERDVRAAQKILLEMYFRDQFLAIDRWGVKRPRGSGLDVYEPSRTLDDVDSLISPNVAMVLNSHIPRDVPMLRRMLAEARARSPENFAKYYAKEWGKRYRDADAEGKTELTYEILSAPNMGPRIYKQLSAEDQGAIMSEALAISFLLNSPGFGPTWFSSNYWGPHSRMGPSINAFLGAIQ